MAKVEVLWFGPDNFFSRMIGKITNSELTHVGIRIGDSFYETLHYTGVRRLEQEQWTIIAKKEIEVPDENIGMVEHWLREQVGRRYGFEYFVVMGIACLFKRYSIPIKPRYLLCSSLVAVALWGLGVYNGPLVVTPGYLATQLGVNVA